MEEMTRLEFKSRPQAFGTTGQAFGYCSSPGAALDLGCFRCWKTSGLPEIFLSFGKYLNLARARKWGSKSRSAS